MFLTSDPDSCYLCPKIRLQIERAGRPSGGVTSSARAQVPGRKRPGPFTAMGEKMLTSTLRTMRRLTLFALLLAMAGMAPTPPVFAQFDTAQMSGVVRDAQGSVVPGATVRVLHKETKLERTYVTDNSGYYTAPALPPGPYQVTVELAGFRLGPNGAPRVSGPGRDGRLLVVGEPE